MARPYIRLTLHNAHRREGATACACPPPSQEAVRLIGERLYGVCVGCQSVTPLSEEALRLIANHLGGLAQTAREALDREEAERAARREESAKRCSHGHIHEEVA